MNYIGMKIVEAVVSKTVYYDMTHVTSTTSRGYHMANLAGFMIYVGVVVAISTFIMLGGLDPIANMLGKLLDRKGDSSKR